MGRFWISGVQKDYFGAWDQDCFLRVYSHSATTVISISIFPPIPTFDFNLILGSFWLFGAIFWVEAKFLFWGLCFLQF